MKLQRSSECTDPLALKIITHENEENMKGKEIEAIARFLEISPPTTRPGAIIQTFRQVAESSVKSPGSATPCFDAAITKLIDSPEATRV